MKNIQIQFGRNRQSQRHACRRMNIETEAGGAARRISPNDIRDNRRRDGREGKYARS